MVLFDGLDFLGGGAKKEVFLNHSEWVVRFFILFSKKRKRLRRKEASTNPSVQGMVFCYIFSSGQEGI